MKNQMESGTLSSQKSVRVLSGSGQYPSSLRSSGGLVISKKNGSSIKSMHSFTSKSVSQKFDQESRFSIVLPPPEEESCVIIEQSGVWNTQRFMGRTIEKSLSPNHASNSPPQSHRLRKKIEKKNYSSFNNLDINADKDSLAAKKFQSPRSINNVNDPILERGLKSLKMTP